MEVEGSNLPENCRFVSRLAGPAGGEVRANSAKSRNWSDWVDFAGAWSIESELVAFFVENEGRLIPRKELLESVWRMLGHIQTRAPDQFILRLRKIFETDPTAPQHFLTIRDLGYRFLAQPETT